MPTRVVVADDHIGLNIAFAGNEDISSRIFEHRKKVVYHYLSGKFVFDGSQYPSTLPLPAVEALLVVPAVRVPQSDITADESAIDIGGMFA
jgi:hypothetical protein